MKRIFALLFISAIVSGCGIFGNSEAEPEEEKPDNQSDKTAAETQEDELLHTLHNKSHTNEKRADPMFPFQSNRILAVSAALSGLFSFIVLLLTIYHHVTMKQLIKTNHGNQ